MLKQKCSRLHDFCNAGFVISSKNRRSVCNNQGFPLFIGKLRELCGTESNIFLLIQKNASAVIVFDFAGMNLRMTAGIHCIRGIHMRCKADDRCGVLPSLALFVASCVKLFFRNRDVARDGCIDVAFLLIQYHVRGAHLLKLTRKEPCQISLAGSGRGIIDSLFGLCKHLRIADQAICQLFLVKM